MTDHFCIQFKQTYWHPHLDGCIIADAIMDSIVHNCGIMSINHITSSFSSNPILNDSINNSIT